MPCSVNGATGRSPKACTLHIGQGFEDAHVKGSWPPPQLQPPRLRQRQPTTQRHQQRQLYAKQHRQVFPQSRSSQCLIRVHSSAACKTLERGLLLLMQMESTNNGRE